uniref:F-box domain-containing protein n=1 Tax=Quercus lobata TaxID=97700 RepID=A0A7N2R087_QUELO
MNDGVGAMDRISELPKVIIHHILSFLSTKAVAKTSLLSKRWKSFTISYPVLDFNENYFQRLEKNEMHQPYHTWGTDYMPFRPKYPEFSTREDVMHFVNKSLLKFCEQKICIDTFKLQVSFTNMEEALVDKWIEWAVENCVKVLEVSVRMKNEERYILPQIDFSANTITVLKLSGCNLERPVNLKNTINFYSLKELSLRRVYVVEEMLHNLISRCPSIENLSLIYCLGLKKFQALKPLKYFCIFPTYRLFESVYVEGSSLRYLRYEHPNGRLGEIKVNACQNLGVLYLKSASITDQWLYDLNTKFPHLHSLTLFSCDLLEKVHISSHSLKNFTLIKGCELRETEIDTPNLQNFIVDYGFKRPFPKLSFKSAPCQTTAKFHLDSRMQLNTDWLLELREFLEKPIQIKTLFLHLFGKVKCNLDEFIPTPPYDLEILKLQCELSPRSRYSDYVDALLLTCLNSFDAPEMVHNPYVEFFFYDGYLHHFGLSMDPAQLAHPTRSNPTQKVLGGFDGCSSQGQDRAKDSGLFRVRVNPT